MLAKRISPTAGLEGHSSEANEQGSVFKVSKTFMRKHNYRGMLSSLDGAKE